MTTVKKTIYTAIVGTLIGLFFLNSSALALDTSSEEASCAEIGFKRKTPAFANCVMELVERNSAATFTDPDDATCRKYGFKRKTNEYAACRQQIDHARQEGQRQQAQHAQQQRQLDELNKQREREKGMAMLQLGLGMASGKYNPSNGYGKSPTSSLPDPINNTYILPGGKMMHCNTVGNVTNCF